MFGSMSVVDPYLDRNAGKLLQGRVLRLEGLVPCPTRVLPGTNVRILIESPDVSWTNPYAFECRMPRA